MTRTRQHQANVFTARFRDKLNWELYMNQSLPALFGFLLAVAPTAHAQFNFTTNNGAITINGYTGTNSVITIPATLNGLLVTSIAIDAFQDSVLTDITLPGSITNLVNWYYGIGAFEGCLTLTAINVDAANPTYSSVNGVLFDKSQTTLLLYPPVLTGHFTIPAGVTRIGNDAFIGCSLTEVTIPSSLSYIGVAAFANSANLTKVYCEGNAPSTTGSDSGVFVGDYENNAKVYYLPGTSGWSESLFFLPTELWLPQIQTGDSSFVVRTNQFGFKINWAKGRTVVVEARSDMTNPMWQPIQTNILASDSFYYSDPQSTHYPARFYRLRSP